MRLLERNRELTAIKAVVDRGGVLVVEGGAGIGKTSLLKAAADLAARRGHEVLRGRGSDLETAFAFGVVRQIFEARLVRSSANERKTILAGAAAAALPLLSGQPAAGSDLDTSFAVLHGLYWLAANMAAIRPLALIVDDAHLADEPSLRWLAYLASRVEGLPLSLVIALREGEPGADAPSIVSVRRGATIIRPKLLSQRAASQMIRSAVRHDPTDEFCSRIWHASGGNPFYLGELLRAPDSGAATATSLAGHVAARVRRLDRRALRLAQALAVLGDETELRHAAAVAALDIQTAMRLAAGLVRLEILADDEPPRFLHPVLLEAVESSMANDERDTAHRTAARVLYADDAPPGRIAAHLTRLRPAADPWVLARLCEAGRAALESGAPLVAADLYSRALAEPPASQERVAVLRESARAELVAGRQAACDQLDEALRLEVDPHVRSEIGLELAEAHANLYHWATAFEVCRRTLAELGEADAKLASKLRAEMAVCGLRDARCALQAMRVLETLDAEGLEGGAAEAYAGARGLGELMMVGSSARDVLAPLEAGFRRAGARAENWDLRLPGLVTMIWAEGFDLAAAVIGAMLREVNRSGSARGMHVTYVTFALLNLRLGNLPEADAAARTALRVLQAADFEQGLPLVLTVLSDVAIEAGQLDEAESVLGIFRGQAPPQALPAAAPPAARARLRLAQGRPREALAEFETSRALLSAEAWGVEMRDNGMFHTRSGSALALLRLGEPDRARELADAELADARVFAAPRALGVALRVAGLTRGGEPGLQLLNESVSALRRSPARLELAQSLVELGAAVRRAGRSAIAREPLAEALDLAARCGARPLAARAREELQATGARPRREWRTGVEALTPSELRVARMATEGRTNREIAQELYVTVKTVEGHLARAYGKLDIEGRAELVQWLQSDK
jgi:DNA-binding CsgD family transcriptional regulator